MPILGYSFGATQTGTWFRSGESYKVSLNASGGNLNQYFKVTFEDILISSLTDENGDGVYQGLVVMPDPGAVQSAGINATASLSLLVGARATEQSFSVDIETSNAGVISDRSTGQPLANASVAVVVEQASSSGQRFFTTWSTSQSGQPNPQVTGADGKYSYSANVGTYRLDVVRAGYQPYRSGDIDASTTALNMNIALSPAIAEAATQQVLITESGFQPATLNAKAGDVIEFVNVDLVDHGVTGSTWNSGVLGAGQSYKVKVSANGTYVYSDVTDGSTQGTVVVGEGGSVGGQRLFLPLALK
jgi:plastocyanin